MWTTIHMIEGIDKAKNAEEILSKEGFLVKIKPFSKEGENVLYEILVPEFEAGDAQSVILDTDF